MRGEICIINNMKDKIIHLGTIKWFGGYNKIKQRYNNGGVLLEGFWFGEAIFDCPYKEKYRLAQIKNEKAFFSFYNDKNPEAGISWVKCIRDMNEAELLDLYHNNESLKQIIDDPHNLSSFLAYPFINSIIHELLLNSDILELVKAIVNKPSYSTNLMDLILTSIEWTKLPKETALNLFLVLQDHRIEKVSILNSVFPAWTDDTRIINSLKSSYFPECINSWINDKDYVSLSKLFHSISNQETKKAMAASMPYGCFLSDPEYCKALDDNRLTNIIRHEYNPSESNSLNKLKTLFSIVEPSKYPNTAIELGDILYKSNLSISIWELLSNAEKVWFILYLSLHLNEADSWKTSFKKLYEYEHVTIQPKNYSVIAATEFLNIALVEESEKQKTFDSAHDSLEQAIEHDFDTLQHPSHEMMQLICRCKKDQNLVCDARYWKSRNGIWCHTKREPCASFPKRDGVINYDITNYVYNNAIYNSKTSLYCLSLADLLNNIGFIPKLDHVYIPILQYQWQFEEYPYRIGGRITQLNRLFSHMHCRCGLIMKSEYAFSIKINARMSITRASCPESQNNTAEHDSGVYLNECWNCGEVIDSRESKYMQAEDGHYYPANQTNPRDYYVCMKCGAGRINIAPAICPNCGCTDMNQLDITYPQPNNRQKGYFNRCRSCNYSKNSWTSSFESFLKQKSKVDQIVEVRDALSFETEDDVFPF